MRASLSYFIVCLSLILGNFQVQASDYSSGINGLDSLLPSVFLIGENEGQFEELNLDYQVMLLSACENNMDVAYDKWLGLLMQMESFAEVNKFDLKGLKCWLNIFWEKDGSIKHIAYYLKPNSKNVDLRYLTTFFEEFMKTYTFPLVSDTRYSHYGSASFPTFQRREKVVPVPNPTGLVKDGKNVSPNKY